MNKIGFTTVTFRKLSRRQICETAAENKIEYLEWGGDVHLPPGDREALCEVISLQKEFNIKALSYGSYYRLGDNDMELWGKILDTAEAIGAKIIRIWQGCKGSSETCRDCFDKMVSETQSLADAAAERNMTVAFEFHKRTNNDTACSCIDFLKAVNRENVRTYWQPFACSDAEDAENLREVLPYVITIHVFTWNECGERFSLAEGEKKWKEFIAIASEYGKDINYIMEFVKDDCTQQFSKDLKSLRSWLKK